MPGLLDPCQVVLGAEGVEPVAEYGSFLLDRIELRLRIGQAGPPSAEQRHDPLALGFLARENLLESTTLIAHVGHLTEAGAQLLLGFGQGIARVEDERPAVGPHFVLEPRAPNELGMAAT